MQVKENIPPPSPPKTYDLIGLSQEEVDMLRYFADAARVARAHLAATATRFLSKTSQFASGTYKPEECFK